MFASPFASSITMSRFSSFAPSANIPFPPHAKITVVELLAFLPRSLHSRDVVYRLVSNDVHFKTIATIINHYRAWESDLFDARLKVSTTMISTMRAGGYDGWKVQKHSNWHKHRKETWDSTNLSVGSFKTPLQYGVGHNETGDTLSIPFKDLAPDPERLPEGDDALDLTRMVRYAVEHPDEIWMYPWDYDALLVKVGGPVEARPLNSDFQARMRWQHIIDEQPKIRGETFSRKKRRERSGSPLTIQNAPKKKKIEKIASATSDADDADDSGCEEGAVERIETEKGEFQIRGIVEPENPDAGTIKTDKHKFSYSRPTPSYVQAPVIKIWPTEEMERELEEEFRLYGNLSFFNESHPYAANAFNGPRSEPPYRFLFRIDDPEANDISGWAENLRWAREQHEKFKAVGWTESPGDMMSIWKIRQEQGWLSEECVAVYEEEDADKGM
ncbi:hypothetical protein P154DRAFT_458785 [Amniculicola lignicola CBS 123094]|uniref:Uncharacterized protein n=1 Tax=Amniculicola lignicola CBS 123094 TaxID=1392246 RepID=A0A6A5X062_9PLEO|nr:hypothetical protein P154DRAFT_458785 [Amniculicola lignicola CBS 123094]